MQSFLDAVMFHLARDVTSFIIGGSIFLVALLYVTYKNNPH